MMYDIYIYDSKRLRGTLQDLSHFAAANHTALFKILKKHDKQTGGQLSGRLLPGIAEPFEKGAKRRLEELEQQLKAFGASLGVDEWQGWANERNREQLLVMQVARIAFSLGAPLMHGCIHCMMSYIRCHAS